MSLHILQMAIGACDKPLKQENKSSFHTASEAMSHNQVRFILSFTY